MITKEYIKTLTNTSSYNKGRSIWNSHWKIEEFSIERDGMLEFIDATVLGSYDNEYEVTVAYNTEKDAVQDIYCDCPAFESYSGICKHCVAVLLEYEEHCECQAIIQESHGLSQDVQKNMQGRESKKDLKPLQRKPVRKTTPQMKELLERQMRTRMAPYQQRELAGQVNVEPYLTCGPEKVELKFKIGANQMYILQDVFSFAERVHTKADYSYGKKLKFIHSMEMFTEEAKKIVGFILDWTKRNEEHFVRPVYYYGYGMGTETVKLKEIPLNGFELEEFLQTLGERPVMVDGNLKTVKYETPRRELKITGKEDGIEIELPGLLEYSGGKYNICFQNDAIYCIPREEEQLAWILQRCMENNGGIPIYIQDEDVPAFCSELLPELEKNFDCRKIDFDETKYVTNPAQFKIYLDMPQKEYITCKIQVDYGEQSYNLMDKEIHRNSRDVFREMEVEQYISSWFNAYNPQDKMWVIAEDEDMIYELLTKGIVSFRELGEVFVSDELKKLKVRSTAKVTAGVSLSGNLLELKMSVDDIPRDELLEILCRYQKKKKFYRMRNGEFLNIEDERIQTLYELKQGMGIKDSEFKKEEILLPKYRALYLETQLKENLSLPVAKNKEFKALVRNMKTIEDNDFELPQQMEELLREYQKRGFLWIKTLKHNGFGGILADDMGLGKTLQVIAFLLSEFQERKEGQSCRSLIVAPASLVYNWQNEIMRFAPELHVKMIVGTASEREKLIKSSGDDEILLTSYDLLKRDITHYSGMTFANQIIDEAQYIKNYNTQGAKAVKKIQSDFRLALTGTPVENRLSELWSIFDYLMPGFLYPYQRFRKELEVPIVQKGDGEAAQRLQKMIRPFVLRRLKQEVLKDLPDKIEKNMYAKMEAEQQQLYDAHVKRLKMMLDKQSDEEFRNSKIVVLSELTKLRQLCCYPGLLYEDYLNISAKECLCLELIENAISGGHKVLLFSQFTTMLERLTKLFEQRKISYCLLTGATSKEKRNRMVQDFEENDTSVFCISLKAGGTGLNLTAADIVIHYDPWWNLAVQNQATDRAHRIGQKNVVSVYKLLAEGTIEENIVKLQERKKELADQILSGEELATGSFNREELLELLGDEV